MDHPGIHEELTGPVEAAPKGLLYVTGKAEPGPVQPVGPAERGHQTVAHHLLGGRALLHSFPQSVGKKL